MFGKLAQIAATCFAASMLQGSNAALTELVNGDDPSEKLNPFDFGIITFYKESDADSVEINNLFEEAETALAEKLGQEEYDSRKIGWFKVDFEKTPTLAMSEDKVN